MAPQPSDRASRAWAQRLLEPLARLGRAGLGALAGLGRAHLLLLGILAGSAEVLWRPRLLLVQVFNVGVLSVLIVAVSGLFVGMVLGLQGYYVLSQFRAEESLGVMVAASLVRELGPVVTALLFAGRAGTSLTAEIGLMKAGEQLAAMEMMAIDPKSRVLAPRFLAGMISMPILAVLFSAIGILGAYVVAVLLIGVDAGNFWSIMQSKVDVWRDVGNGVVKSAVFGVICTFVALYQGFETDATPEGVAYATTRTVVMSSLGVLGMDFVLTALMFSTP
jgi:phospholipid/cholesterol/gamma-HCH transport system permease protein